jgi:hypothetical protein
MSIIVSILHYFRILAKKLCSTDTATYSKITINSGRFKNEYILKLTPTYTDSTDFFKTKKERKLQCNFTTTIN